ncbi:MAG: flagellar biosynthetic protein FliQ [Bdellovibrionales bacterium]|nr:flagellar biosynthetic protein FliQ [Bdellovibrionales bacterium]
MLTDQQYEVFSHSMRILLLVGGPLALGMALVSTIVSGLQAATSVRDVSLSYAVRLIALVVLIYLLHPLFMQGVVELTELALR